MTKRDIYSGFKFFQAMGAQIIDATTNGQDVDTQGYTGLTFKVNVGEISLVSTTSYWVVRMQHTDASALGVGPSTYADVTSEHVIASGFGTTVAMTSGIVVSLGISLASAADLESQVYAVGYIGNKRYARMIVEEKGNLSTMTLGIEAMLSPAHDWPVNANAN